MLLPNKLMDINLHSLQYIPLNNRSTGETNYNKRTNTGLFPGGHQSSYIYLPGLTGDSVVKGNMLL